MGLRQTPTRSVGFSRTHCTFFPEVGTLVSFPQQSSSRAQMSPSMWQPLARWQTDTPVVPYGTQTRLQQSPHPEQTVPSTPPLQRVLPGAGVEHRPSVAPDATLQMPPQQSAGLEQTSPFCVQKDDPRSHIPALQSFEQQSALEAHELPEVRQEPLSASHFPLAQFPPQHAPWLVHDAPSDTQVIALHAPLSQESEQQSVPAEHAPPAATHRPTVDVQVWRAGSHSPEQQSLPVPHGRPVTPHTCPLASIFAPPSGSVPVEEPPQLAITSEITQSQNERRYMRISLVQKGREWSVLRPDVCKDEATASSLRLALRATSGGPSPPRRRQRVVR
jgi:hypothetical protein